LHVSELLIPGGDWNRFLINRGDFLVHRGILEKSNFREGISLLKLLDCVSYPVSQVEDLSIDGNIDIPAKSRYKKKNVLFLSPFLKHLKF